MARELNVNIKGKIKIEKGTTLLIVQAYLKWLEKQEGSATVTDNIALSSTESAVQIQSNQLIADQAA